MEKVKGFHISTYFKIKQVFQLFFQINFICRFYNKEKELTYYPFLSRYFDFFIKIIRICILYIYKFLNDKLLPEEIG